MNQIKVGIIRNEDPNSARKWALACDCRNIQYIIINPFINSWLDIIRSEKFSFFLLRPPGTFENYNRWYMDRIAILTLIQEYKIFPSYKECLIYENKKMLFDFLKATGYPHPGTWVTYEKIDSKSIIQQLSLPIVAKTAIGASGSGVRILRTKEKLESYINQAFSQKGIKRKSGPNRVIGSPKKWFFKALKSPKYFIQKLRKYWQIYRQGEKGYVILQEYIQHDFEWRIVKIGHSYFGHKKIKIGDKASGSKGILYDPPPFKLLDFAKSICEKENFHSIAIDIFEDGNGGYLVNEMQTIFGHVQDHLLEYNGVPGRFISINGNWQFEEGDFNQNESYNLRLEVALDLYNSGKL